jgi:DNA polymerase-4
MDVYRAESARIFAIFEEFTPEVEGLSLDEAFLDVTASLRLWPSAREIGERIKQRILKDTGLSCSIGIAPNKLVAKIASDLDKPDGFVTVSPAQVDEFLAPLSASVLPGLGPKAQAALARLGVHSIAELRQIDGLTLKRALGNAAHRFRAMAHGHDARPVGRRADRSLSAERTFERDLDDPQVLQRELATLADKVAARLRAKNLLASLVVLKLRGADFQTFTRQAPLPHQSTETLAILKLGRSLLETWLAEHEGVRLRLLGIGVSGLTTAGQSDWLEDPGGAPVTPLDRATDDIRRRFGSPALTRARQLPDQTTSARRGEG